MLFIANPHALQVTVIQELGSKAVVNVLHYDHGSLASADDLLAFAVAFDMNYATNVRPHTSNRLTYHGVRVRSLASPSSPQAEVTGPGTGAGGVNARYAPSSVALALTLRTSSVGRSYRGRIFVAAPSLSGEGTDYADAGWAASLLAGWQSLMSIEYPGGSKPMCVYSRYFDKEPRAAGILSPVTSIVLRNLRVDSQRRRLPRD